jgi:hypothetical protein
MSIKGTYEENIRIRTMHRNSELFQSYGADFIARDLKVAGSMGGVEKAQLQFLYTCEMSCDV